MLSTELVSVQLESIQSDDNKSSRQLTVAPNGAFSCWQVHGGGSAVAAPGPAFGNPRGIQSLCLPCTMCRDHGMWPNVSTLTLYIYIIYIYI
jgi:hypothetical protein